MKQQLYIGCSGFSYNEWRDTFYPGGLAASGRLTHYASIFDTVEINSTFYHYPKKATLEKFAAAVPEHFRFSFKMGRAITHDSRLKDTKESAFLFQEHVRSVIGAKLLHFLFQLPPSFHFSEENLEMVVQNIPHAPENVVEFRHISWWNDKAFAALTQMGVTFCNVDYPKLPKAFSQTSPFFYLRMHGDPVLFHSDYSRQKLEYLAENLPDQCDRYSIYFNNTASNHAWQNALELRSILT